MTRKKEWVDAAEAVKMLQVNKATLYAYVSRGFIRSEPMPAQSRGRRYAREDIERLRVRAEERRNPEKAAERALHWGVPVLESAITLIADGGLYYRGHDVATLMRGRSLEEVASLLWTGSFDADVFNTPVHVIAGGTAADLPFIHRAQSILPLVASRDPLAFDLRPDGVAKTGWRILNLLTSVAADSRELADTLEETLASSWNVRGKDRPALLRAALIACADHELNVSAFTARCVASARSNPYAVVVAGLTALEGTRHGGLTSRVEAIWDELRRSRDVRKALALRLQRGESIDGFGHPLYRSGDPRATVLLGMLPGGKEREFARAFQESALEITGEAPTIDFALVALSRVLGLPPGSPLTLFAIGRTMGWIAHAIEQYASSEMIRPRAKYVGVNLSS
jgi:citrate synthase